MPSRLLRVPVSLHVQPGLVAGTHVLPQLGAPADQAHDGIDLAVVVEVGKGRAAMHAGRLEILARALRRNRRKVPSPRWRRSRSGRRYCMASNASTVSLTCAPETNRSFQPSLLKSNSAGAPAAAPVAERAHAAAVRDIAKPALAFVVKQRETSRLPAPRRRCRAGRRCRSRGSPRPWPRRPCRHRAAPRRPRARLPRTCRRPRLWNRKFGILSLVTKMSGRPSPS